MSALTDRQAAAIGQFAAATRWTAVPAEVLSFGRLLLLDTLGALLGGLRYPPVQQLAARLAAAEPAGAPVPFARLVTLGTAATWLDADSGGSFHPQGHRLPPVPTAHPAPHVLPVLLHAAATGKVDDARLTEVFLAATEIGLRLSVSSTLRPGLHPHGVHGPGSAAVATALLHGGDASSAYLLGSSTPMAATLQVPMDGGTVRNIWTGLGTYQGALAGYRAAELGPVATDTFTALYDGAVCTDLDPDAVVADLGARWEMRNSYLKPYACARWIHPTLDAVREVLSAAHLTVADVESVTVETFAYAASLGTLEVSSDLQARFSLPWCVAAVLTDGRLDADGFLPAGLDRPAVRELAGRVSVQERPEFTAALPWERPARVTVTFRDKRTAAAEVRNARGNPATALSAAEVERKFRANIGDLLPADLVDQVVAGARATLSSGTYDLSAVARAIDTVLADGERAVIPS